MKYLLLSCLTIFFLPNQQLSAQTTGSFTIGFPSPDTLLTRDSLYISFHVPAAYQHGIPSKLIIGLHGLGNPQTPVEIRDYFAPTGDSVNAIIMCPAPYLQDQPRSKLVVDISIDSMLTWYSIDTNEIYIGGYSAGSDVAAQYNLDNPKHKMKGLIWYAPGFFYQPNLSAQSVFPPTCLCLGTQDFISTILGQTDAIRDSFQNSAFSFFYNEIPGVAHTMQFPGFTREMLECLRFIDDPENFIPDSTTTNIRSSANTASLKIFPNPASENVRIISNEKTSAPVSLRLINAFGKTLAAHTFSSEFELNVSAFAAGIYFLELVSAQRKYYSRLVLTR